MTRLLSQYGSFLVLIILCACYSVVTYEEHQPETPGAGEGLARKIVDQRGRGANVLIVVRDTAGDREFAEALAAELQSLGANVVGTAHVKSPFPANARKAVEKAAAEHDKIDAIATHHTGSQWGPLKPDKIAEAAREFPALRSTQVYKPDSVWWPTFLTVDNLLNVANNTAEIAIIAIGMTMIIITAGIDLSVGSVLALGGIVTAIAVQEIGGGAEASVFGVLGCYLLGIGACALCGALNGLMATTFRVPAFIATLAMMMMARGLALIVAVGYRSALAGGGVASTPELVSVDSEIFNWLGQGKTLGIPNPIVLVIVLYAIAHFVMVYTSIGRYIYAVGGNREAARLSGVPVFWVLLGVYAVCGALTGLAGIVDASRYGGGRPNAGEYYELQVIAAVVVGGTSLYGGEGRVLGTLIGALTVAVIYNGLNMAQVQPYEQMVAFGLLILAAALIDSFRKYGWELFR